MITKQILERFKGKHINVFGLLGDPDRGFQPQFIVSAKLEGVEDECLLLSHEGEEPAGVHEVVDLRIVGLIALSIPCPHADERPARQSAKRPAKKSPKRVR